jgi:diguanylate cyclase (GGDEF)-like protein
MLTLDGHKLFDQATLELHTHFNTHSTCIVEIDPFNSKTSLLATATDKKVTPIDPTTLVPNFACPLVSQTQKDWILIDKEASAQYPSEQYFVDHQIEAFLGIPLKTQQGEVLGILCSTFTSHISTHNIENTIRSHKTLANIVIHSLRAKWLSSRSDTLVEQLSYEVSHDNLTGLLNRSFLSDKLEQLADLKTEPFTLAYIDIDNFKSINDLYGHYIGDQVIMFVAETIQRNIKEKHLAFRIAGDEFAFITLSGDPFDICHKIIDQLEHGYQDATHNIKVNISVGLARHSTQCNSVDQIILNASLALKDCKQSRHLSIQCYDTHLSAQYYRRALIIDALRSELDQKDITKSDLYVVAQPIVTRKQQDWDYYEILARWESKTLGTISPIEFIEAAEQSGLIVDLGERIVELACTAKAELEQGLGYRIKLGLNCSAHELTDSTRYLQHLLATIRQHNFTPYDFTIELTETVLLSQASEVKETLNKLRFLGFTVALDDFGTGYSSLNYIHSYPIDCIKIDATFVRNMLSNETSESVVWLIIQLAKQLNVSLVAEGVENLEELEKLYLMGCDQIQGYYFSRPEKTEVIVDRHLGRLNTGSQVSYG